MNFYFEAAKVLDKLEAKQGSIKGLIGGLSIPEKDRKRTAALVIETLKYKPVLSDVIEKANLLKEERKKLTSKNLALALVHDLLFSSIQAGDGPIKQAILRHKTRLKGELQKIKIKKGVKDITSLAQTEDTRSSNIPRYVRVNALLWTLDEAIKHYTSLGYVLGTFPFDTKKTFARDEHVPNLLLFPATTPFQNDVNYKEGKVILQDKASCFPAVVLNPSATPETIVIDATAAPGNKTSHLSAIMQNQGKLYAFERDKRRFKTLSNMLATAKCTNVEPVNQDFLTIDPSDDKYRLVTHILLDPSCSGSGIVNRLDYLVEDDEEENAESTKDRLQKLASFQLLMIKHAMKFPSVRKIVYSTCSIHAIENEHVVKQALATEEATSFELASSEEVLPTWSRRGIVEECESTERAASLIRCMPGEDATNGFFVSCFVRKTVKRKRNEHSERKRKKPRSM